MIQTRGVYFSTNEKYAPLEGCVDTLKRSKDFYAVKDSKGYIFFFQKWEIYTPGGSWGHLGNIDRVGQFIDVLQGTLDSVKNTPHDTWKSIEDGNLKADCRIHLAPVQLTKVSQFWGQGHQLSLPMSPRTPVVSQVSNSGKQKPSSHCCFWNLNCQLSEEATTWMVAMSPSSLMISPTSSW